ncbi:iron ABC transporter permease [Oscillatoria sp. HE19RPO]|uniref:FecCD family ABC transporter permease n=1 Tax=Oscillatoria sp. HE19RPO TaxID=2954806 RepID=UPI0020C59552|nr:iron ABC transporter permease [Oscillatoria sp. HE19RPO]
MSATQPNPPILRASRFWVAVVALTAMLLALALLSLQLGKPSLNLPQLWEIAIAGQGEPIKRLVFWEIRLPRLILGTLTGSLLALAGVLLQNALRNVLAGPELLGVQSGAAAVMAALVVLQLPIPLSVYPLLALVGGAVGGAIVLLSSKRTSDPVRLVLIGAAMTALLNAVTIALISLGSASSVSLLFLYLLGSLAGRTWDEVQIVLSWAIVGIPLALLCARPLNILQLGDELAEGLGLKVLPTRFAIGVLSVVLVAPAIATCGPIAYIALLAPHLSRNLLGTTDARQVLVLAIPIGALLLVGADLLAREAFAPLEMPVGVWTTLIGGPALLLLLQQQIRRRGS